MKKIKAGILRLFAVQSLIMVVAVSGWGGVSGTVFRDLPVNGSSTNTYGVKDANEFGVAGVTVTAYPGGETNTTDASGAWSLPTSGNVRIQFSQWPGYLKESPSSTVNNSSIRFVNDGNSSVNFGLYDSMEYCSQQPEIASSVMINGKLTNSRNTIVRFPYNSSGIINTSGIGYAGTKVADDSQVGTVWGLAYDRERQAIYSAVFLKRHAAYRGDLGNIWRTKIAGGATVRFARIPDAGTDQVGTNSDRGITGNDTQPSHDNNAYPLIGKIGLGGLAISSDGQYLYTVNLNDKKLYKVAIDADNDPSTNPSNADVEGLDIPDPGCTNGNWRPFAVKYYRESIYVGGVCDAESGGTKNDLLATIYKYDGVDFTKVLSFPLNYNKVSLYGENTETTHQSSQWHPWINSSPASLKHIYPQPVLSDIEFNGRGDMLISFFDRYGHQTGHKNYIVNSNDTHPEVTAGGDILKACLNSDNEFILENNGKCGGVQGAGTNPNAGPGGKEFYNDRFSQNSDVNGHGETSSGGAALVAGSRELILNSMDPVDYKGNGSDQDYFRTGGPAWYAANGKKKRGYQLFKNRDNNAVGWAKGTGVGDLELLCPPAPLEIGNRVWLDSNGDGIQDANEIGISDVHISLICDNTVVATAATDNNGYYIFSNDPNEQNTSSQIYGIAQLQPDNPNNCRIVIQNALSQAPLSGKFLSPAAEGSDTLVDSNGVLNGSDDEATIAPEDIPSSGANNHSYDFGFAPGVAIGNLLFFDDGAGGGTADNGIMDGGEQPVPTGVKVELYKSDNTFLSNTTTDSNGRYYFDNLHPGDYYVKIPASEFGSGGKLKGYRSSTGNSTNQDNEDNIDHGIDNAYPETNGIKSITYTLSIGGEPTGENQQGYAGSVADNSANFTDDFGFVPGLAIGSTVWLDTNNNGTQDAGENGISGVHIQLFHTGDNPTAAAPVAEMDTNGSGNYYFDNLAPGSYFLYIPNPPAGAPASSTDLSTTNGDNQIDGDDNGLQPDGIGQPVHSYDIVLQIGQEPQSSDENFQGGDQDDNIESSGDMTIDFGFWKPIPSIDLEKHTNGADADDANGTDVPRVQLGDAISWEYIVTNTGTDTLVDVNVTDSPAETITCDHTTLAPGDSMTCTASGTAGALGLYENNATVTAEGNVSGTAVTDSDPSHYIVPAVALGSLIWEDTNNNGVQDAGESGIKGATVTLLDDQGNSALDPATGQPYPTVSTGTNGKYCFCNLPEGNYSVQATMPAGYIAAANQQSDANTDNATDSNIAQSDDASHTYTSGVVALTDQGEPENENSPISGSDDPSDCGCALPDKNTNATVDLGFYKPIPSIDLEKHTNGADADDANGTDVPRVQLGDAISWEYIVTNTGTDTLVDVNVTDSPAETITCDHTTLAPGDSMTCTASGTAGALGLYENNATVTAEGNVSGTAVTDSDPSHYIVPAVALGSLIWEDTNNNGVQDAGESGIKGATVTLLDDQGNSALDPATGQPYPTVSTGTNGKYCFCNLPEGNYSVQATMPAGYIAAANQQSDANTDNATDSNIAQSDDASHTYTSGVVALTDQGEPENENSPISGSDDPSDCGCALPDKNTNATVDLGFYPLASIGDTVWYDTNANGIQDHGETGVPGITVTLMDTNGTQIATTTTDSSGQYLFTEVMPGGYQVQFDLNTIPDSYLVSPKDQGSDDGQDSDTDPNTGKTTMTTLEPGENDVSWDLGIYPLASIGDTVWSDTNANGIQDPSEQGLPGIAVHLLDSNGSQVGIAMTDANGHYAFDHLIPGDYQIEFDPNTIPDGYSISPKDQGNNDVKDSDADPSTGKTVNTKLEPGENDPNWDMGIKQDLYRIGDLFWVDGNSNGEYDSGEETIGNAKVELLDENGDVMATTTTDSNGHYHFDVPAGQYRVRFYIPQEMIDQGYTFVNTRKEGDDTNKVNAEGVVETAVEVGPGFASANLTLDAAIQCPCANVTSNSINALSRFSIVLMLFVILILGMFFLRQEKVSDYSTR